VAAVVQALRAEDGRLSRLTHDLLGPESLFIGQLHYGDFYNRSPRSCTLQGTRRWHPGRTFEDAEAGMADLLAATALPAGITATVAWTFVGESFALDPGERIVKALQAAFRDLRGVAPRPAGVAAVLDTSRLVPFGRVPAVPIDCDGATGHADDELVRLPVVAEACRLARETVRRYLGMQPEGPA
jgi:acetylornithine deacetylase/succinyl-diaminopimelate desuccinylase-like protein